MTRRSASGHTRLIAAMGLEVVRFQEESAALDDVAARILAVNRGDLPCMTLLLFGGAASIAHLTAALHQPRGAVTGTIERLELAGYARRRHGGDDTTIELTTHAREWIDRIWAPLRDDGRRLLGSHSHRELATLHSFMVRARQIQERQISKLRRWLELPASPARRTHLRGGLSPAAMRRVQVFVEANLARPIRLADLAARAGLSGSHFSRAFKTSAGMTPRTFIEQRRLEHATRLLDESEQSLAQIAVESGFGTQSRMTTTFKRRTRFTPAQYRRDR